MIHTVERRPPLPSGRHPLHIRCRDFTIVTFLLEEDKQTHYVYDAIQKLTCVDSPEKLFAYQFQPPEPYVTNNGWEVYDIVNEYSRMGVDVTSDSWRISLLNRDYKYSPTYPRFLVVPTRMTDATLNYAAKYRSKARIPALSYLHWSNMATITRSSQPMVGFKQARSIQDEKLIEAIFASNVPVVPSGQTLYGSTAANLIVDARPMANAMGNVARGAGTENMENYRNCKKIYVAIENIHSMRDSLTKLVEAMQGTETNGQVSRLALHRSNWIKHIGTIMDGALSIVKNVHVFNSHVLVHCSDGWDRTAQLVSISEICLDPYYRTYQGLQVLIEKEWVSFGHKFSDRSGHLAHDKCFVNLAHSGGNAATNTIKDMQNKFYKSNYYQRETSPVFHQFLDCLYQLMLQFPTRFEFNETMLIELHYHLYSCQFGNFLFNCEAERTLHRPEKRTQCIWDYLNTEKARFVNPLFDPMKDHDLVDGGGVLFPDTHPIKYWAGLFKRTDEEVNGSSVEGLQEQAEEGPLAL
ncbi:protein-tyrosine phosphatase-like protein [Spinellus fusiger]|nr:protein-tyrosine phosphatase-like protein [Spinellus fusiger]